VRVENIVEALQQTSRSDKLRVIPFAKGLGPRLMIDVIGEIE
jgi:hypothetical protein